MTENKEQKETFNFGVTDLDGKPVPDSKIGPVLRDIILSSEDKVASCKNGVNAYFYDGYDEPKTMPLKDVNPDKYIVKYIAGLWRVRPKPTNEYKIIPVYDKRFVLGSEIKINERDDFGFRYYKAALEHYDLFGVLEVDFKFFVAVCDTKQGPMMRYGQTREEARAFLRGAIMDTFAPHIAAFVLSEKQQKVK
jgi:hypothetical protein